MGRDEQTETDKIGFGQKSRKICFGANMSLMQFMSAEPIFYRLDAAVNIILSI